MANSRKENRKQKQILNTENKARNQENRKYENKSKKTRKQFLIS